MFTFRQCDPIVDLITYIFEDKFDIILVKQSDIGKLLINIDYLYRNNIDR